MAALDQRRIDNDAAHHVARREELRDSIRRRVACGDTRDRPSRGGPHTSGEDTGMSVGTIGSSESLRHAMVDRLAVDHAAKGLTLRPEVEAAMRAVPRELYTPGLALEEAYANEAVLKKRRGEEAISSVTAPFLIAEMLGQAADALGDLEGRDALEIGSGGYNASLLRELVGPSGSVTTVDIDLEVTSRAVACLAAAGYDDVTVMCADAEHPIAPGRCYDLIIVTAGAWDVPPAWREQLTDDGVLVVPLRTFGITKSWALRRRADRLVSASHRQCGFVSMQGAGAHEMRYIDIADGVHLRLDEGQQIDPTAVAGLLGKPREQAWAGVSVPPRTTLIDLNLWLATRLTREAGEFVVLTAQETAIESGIVAPSWQFGTPAILHEGTFAYRSALRWTDRRFDLGAYAHGPEAAAAAERMVEHMRAWVDAGNPPPVLHVLPAHTPDGDLPGGAVLDKRHSRLVLAFTSTEKGTP
ncbi:MAG TPA: methyltransferase, FxLD system [Pseudonocardiaceae bacterium]|nr:methyltransferase, FxLD system [Pseudonocardiaceae bacterium]